MRKSVGFFSIVFLLFAASKSAKADYLSLAASHLASTVQNQRPAQEKAVDEAYSFEVPTFDKDTYTMKIRINRDSYAYSIDTDQYTTDGWAAKMIFKKDSSVRFSLHGGWILSFEKEGKVTLGVTTGGVPSQLINNPVEGKKISK